MGWCGGRRVAVNGGTAALLAALLVDGLPETSLLHRVLKDRLDPILDVSGLWQGSWQLFAPEVDKVNTRVSARIRLSDGSQRGWQSPDWPALSRWQRFRSFRHMEYWDSIRMDQNRGAWPALAAHLARSAAGPARRATRVVEVVLTRHWAEIPPPTGPAAVPLVPYREFKAKYDFLRWRPPR
jgi:hypothetical protein